MNNLKNKIGFGIFCLIYITVILTGCNTSNNEEGSFKDWNIAPERVFGIGKIESPNGRDHFRIKRNDNGVVTVEKVNSCGTIVYTNIVKYVEGRLSLLTETNQWGSVTRTISFEHEKPNELIANEIVNGVNVCSPCNAYKLIFDGDLIIEKKYINFEGKPCTEKLGNSIIKYERFKDGKLLGLIKSQAFFDEKSNPITDDDWNCHKVIFEYDDKGNELSQEYFSPNGSPVKISGIYNLRTEYDVNDNVIEEKYLALNGSPINSVYGFAKVLFKYKDNLMLQKTCFNDKNEVIDFIPSEDLAPITKYAYDAKGNKTECSYFDRDDSPIAIDGIHKIIYKFNVNNNKVEEIYFGRNNEKVVDEEGIHHYFFVYDNKGREIQRAYFGVDDQPIINNVDKVYLMKFKYDDDNRLISKSYWKDAMTKMERWNGFAESVNKYDQNGNRTEFITLDESGQLKLNESGYSRCKLEYNKEGQIVSRSWFDVDKPVNTKNSSISDYHLIRYNYEKNKISSLAYYDALGNPTNASISLDGNNVYTHKVEFKYKGEDLTEQKLYLTSSNVPIKFIDCKSGKEYVNTSGVSQIK
jgi:hypothetical protein